MQDWSCLQRKKEPTITREKFVELISQGHNTMNKLAEVLGIRYSSVYRYVSNYGLHNSLEKRDSHKEDEETFKALTKAWEELRVVKEADKIFAKELMGIIGKRVSGKTMERWAKENCKEFLDSRKNVNRVK
jgi:predicted transcriptional regulator